MHPGRQVVHGPTVAPSPVPLNSHAPIPHELTEAEIADIVEDYAKAADLAREAGFDFVEVHGAHGYLPSNFLSPLDNRRADDYGGSAREPRAVQPRGRARDHRHGRPEMPLVWRINGDDGMPGGLTIDETRRGLAAGWRRPASRRSASPPAPGTRCT